MPTLTGFIWFIQNIVGMNTTVLPVDSPFIQYSYDFAVSIVNNQIIAAGGNLYSTAVYNLATDYLINFAQDQANQTFFTDKRKDFNIFDFVPGVVEQASDVSTSDALLTPEFLSGLTLSDLQRLKTPYGRQYLQIAQSYGCLWGLS